MPSLRRAALGLAAAAAPAVVRIRSLLAPRSSPDEYLYVIGDSHASFFSGGADMIDAWPSWSTNTRDGFKTCRLGAALAYHLPDFGSTSAGREKLLCALAYGPVHPHATVLLCFGEIDCRFHLQRQAERRGAPVDAVVRQAVGRYAGVLREIRELGFNVAAWGVIPPDDAAQSAPDPECPEYGTTGERTEVARAFNRGLAAALKPASIPLVSIFDELLGEDGLAQSRYYVDRIHLGPEALPLAIDALKRSGLLR
jgi:hypothetical protein